MKPTDFKVKAIKEFNDADPKTKQSLKNIFGDKFFLPITERINSYEDACKELGLDPIKELPFQNPLNDRQEATNAFHRNQIVAEALLEGVVLDYTNSNQRKWMPLFVMESSGVGFRFLVSDYDWANSETNGGARLCVDTEANSDHFAKIAKADWDKLLKSIN